MRGCKLLAFSALALVSATSLSMADGRANPFAKPPTEAERKAAEEERIREIVIDMTPVVERTVMRQVQRTLSDSEARTKRRTDEVGATLEAVQSSIEEIKKNGVAVAKVDGDGTAPEAEAPEETNNSKLPEGATFISCINGKALYRASDKLITLEASEAPADSGCAG